MEVGTIRQINIDNEMQASYLDYAMSVIVARALPDVRDGLKPVHRRILYAMHDLGLTNDKPYKKSARIVGEVLGKYHPHGDAAVYEAMVRMAQDFSLRYPLVDGQGNFGSVDGDNAAAMRYTEARLAAIANEMLADIDKDTVDWTDNFDGTLREPTVLPAALPNLVINGSAGIAVGMATNIPPHNLGEICDALAYLIDNYARAEDVSTEDLMRFVQGPDFPTGGIVFRYEHEGSGAEAEQVDAIEKAYGSGRGALVVQARAHIEEMSRSRSRIVVTELPYQTDKSRLLERIAELVRDGRIEGITDLRDESDRTGMRVCIEMTRTVDPRQVLADLYKYTPLQSTFGVSLLALVDGEPRLLSLKKMLLHFIEHRQQVILRRTRHDVAKARERAHILEGLLRALDVLDEIIALIRRSRTADIARQELIKQFSFSQAQAQAILDMQLRRLAALERQKLQDEYKQVQKLIKELEALLNSPQKVLALIKENLADLKARYGDARRTQIADRAKAVLTARDHVVERDVWVAATADGKLAAYSREFGEKLPLPVRPPASAPSLLVPVNTRQDLFLFTVSGRAACVAGHQLPDAPGVAVSSLTGLNEPLAALLPLLPAEGDVEVTGYVLMGSAQGKVKRISLADLLSQAHNSPQVIGLEEGDQLVWVGVSEGEGDVFLFTAAGQAIRFAEEEVRAMGLPAGGIGGIRLRERDRVVAGCVLSKEPAATHIGIAMVSGGFVKQVQLSDFPTQGRNGLGVMAASLSPRSGDVAGAAPLGPRDLFVCLSPGGKTQFLRADAIPAMARASQGKNLLAKEASIDRVYSLPAGEPDAAGERPGGGGPPASRARGRQESANGHKRNSGSPKSGTNGHDGSTSGNGSVTGGKRAKIKAAPGAGAETAKAGSRRAASALTAGQGRAKAAGPPAKTRSATAGHDDAGASKSDKDPTPSTPGRAAAVAPGPAGSRARKAAPAIEVAGAAPGEKQADVQAHEPPAKRGQAAAPVSQTEVPPAVNKPRSSKTTTTAAGKSPATMAPTAGRSKKGGQPAAPAELEVSRTPVSITYDREALRQAVPLPSPSTREHAGGAQQLPLVPPEEPAVAVSGRKGKTTAPGETAKASAKGAQAVEATKPGTAKAVKPGPPRGKTASSVSASKDKKAQVQRGPAGSATAAGRSSPKSSAAEPAGSRARHSSADGPMTWPLVPTPEEEDD